MGQPRARLPGRDLTAPPALADTEPMAAPAAIRLRRAGRADGPAVAEVYILSRRGAAGYMPPSIHTDDDIRQWVTTQMVPALEVWVAEADGSGIVGFLALAGEMVDHLFVAPAAQRIGVGGRLLAKAKELRPERLRLYTFQSNTPARTFYEARGFSAIDFNSGQRNEEHQPDVLYEWTAAGGR
jgi:GNAT superfamily N-acetyltransferase